jgi:hypothetical protein
MLIPVTRESARLRAPVISTEPLMSILAPEDVRMLRFRLSYRSGLAGGCMDYGTTGGLSLVEAERLCVFSDERDAENFKVLVQGVRAAMWGRAE